MPVLFIGHGNPMNAITDNLYSDTWRKLGEKLRQTLPKPKAILSISAHWITTDETLVLTANPPKTIHDFYGFPQALFDQQYSCPGASDLASETASLIQSTHVKLSDDWGLDHGTWSVLLSMYPEADIPVYQISMDYLKPASFHYQLAQELNSLRDKGVLIMASGNVVHNLRAVYDGNPKDWALEFNRFVYQSLKTRDDQRLINFKDLSEISKLAHPTHDHLLPIFYAMGLKDDNDKLYTFNNRIDLSSISMLSFAYLPMT